MRTIIIGVLLIFLICPFANAKVLDSVDVSTGFSTGRLQNKPDYEVIPVYFSLNFNIKPLIGLHPKGYLNFVLEPFACAVVKPKMNMEFGCSIYLRYAHPLTMKIYAYVKAGSGIVYESQEFNEQSTSVNFRSQGEIGILYFVKKNVSLNFGVSYGHDSNGGRKEPNLGINKINYKIGVAVYFKQIIIIVKKSKLSKWGLGYE
jgi:hypothetical protein